MNTYLNTIDFSMRFQFTSERRLSDFELRSLHQALQSAMAQQDGPAEVLLDALREQVADLDCEPDSFEASGPLMREGRPVNDKLASDWIKGD